MTKQVGKRSTCLRKKIQARIIHAELHGRRIPTSTANTGLSQRETLEAIILNLASALEISEVSKCMSARGSEFYRAGPSGNFQRASNTILEVSKRLLQCLPILGSDPRSTYRTLWSLQNPNYYVLNCPSTDTRAKKHDSFISAGNRRSTAPIC